MGKKEIRSFSKLTICNIDLLYRNMCKSFHGNLYYFSSQCCQLDGVLGDYTKGPKGVFV